MDEAATSRSKASCWSPSSTSSRSSRLVSSGWGIGGRDLGLGGGLGGGCCCCCSSCCCCCCLLILFSSRWCLSLETSSEVNWMVDVCPPRNFSQPGAPADLGANFELFNKSVFKNRVSVYLWRQWWLATPSLAAAPAPRSPSWGCRRRSCRSECRRRCRCGCRCYCWRRRA